jgi:hypothetical protein
VSFVIFISALSAPNECLFSRNTAEKDVGPKKPPADLPCGMSFDEGVLVMEAEWRESEVGEASCGEGEVIGVEERVGAGVSL